MPWQSNQRTLRYRPQRRHLYTPNTTFHGWSGHTRHNSQLNVESLSGLQIRLGSDPRAFFGGQLVDVDTAVVVDQHGELGG